MSSKGRWVTAMLVMVTACGGDGASRDSAGGTPAAATSTTPPPPRPPVDPRVRELAAGRALYEENCLLCHGLRGAGDGTGISRLEVKPVDVRVHFADHPVDEMVARVMAGVPPSMPASPISEDEVRLVLSYLLSLQPDSVQARVRSQGATEAR